MFAAIVAVAAYFGAQSAVEFAPATLRAAKAEAVIPTNDMQATPGPETAGIAKSADGHFWAEGDVNGRTVRFLVDTGATAVALTPKDAEKLGFRAEDLNYGSSVLTAAGKTRAAPVKLVSISVGGAKLENVDAVVIEQGLDASLLGMSYLGRLSRFEATRTRLVLQP